MNLDSPDGPVRKGQWYDGNHNTTLFAQNSHDTNGVVSKVKNNEKEPIVEDEPRDLGGPQASQSPKFTPFLSVIDVRDEDVEVRIGLGQFNGPLQLQPACSECESLRKDGSVPKIYVCSECPEFKSAPRPLCKDCERREFDKKDLSHKPTHYVREWQPTLHYDMTAVMSDPILSAPIEHFAEYANPDDLRTLTFRSRSHYDNRLLRCFLPTPTGHYRVVVGLQMDPCKSSKKNRWTSDDEVAFEIRASAFTSLYPASSSTSRDPQSIPYDPPRKTAKPHRNEFVLKHGKQMSGACTIELYIDVVEQDAIEIALQDKFTQSEHYNSPPFFKWRLETIEITQISPDENHALASQIYSYSQSLVTQKQREKEEATNARTEKIKSGIEMAGQAFDLGEKLMKLRPRRKAKEQEAQPTKQDERRTPVPGERYSVLNRYSDAHHHRPSAHISGGGGHSMPKVYPDPQSRGAPEYTNSARKSLPLNSHLDPLGHQSSPEKTGGSQSSFLPKIDSASAVPQFKQQTIPPTPIATHNAPAHDQFQPISRREVRRRLSSDPKDTDVASSSNTTRFRPQSIDVYTKSNQEGTYRLRSSSPHLDRFAPTRSADLSPARDSSRSRDQGRDNLAPRRTSPPESNLIPSQDSSRVRSRGRDRSAPGDSTTSRALNFSPPRGHNCRRDQGSHSPSQTYDHLQTTPGRGRRRDSSTSGQVNPPRALDHSPSRSYSRSQDQDRGAPSPNHRSQSISYGRDQASPRQSSHYASRPGSGSLRPSDARIDPRRERARSTSPGGIYRSQSQSKRAAGNHGGLRSASTGSGSGYAYEQVLVIKSFSFFTKWLHHSDINDVILCEDFAIYLCH